MAKHSVRPGICRHCLRTADIAGKISFNGQCSDCGIKRMTDQAVGNSRKEGPAYIARLRGYRRWIDSELARLGEDDREYPPPLDAA